MKAMQKVMAKQQSVPTVTTDDKRPSFFLKGDKKTHQIHADDILFVEAHGNYTKIYMAEETIVIHEKISSLEKLLPDADFLRIHKSFIVARSKIELIEGNRITIRDHHVPVGQSYKYNLKQLFKGG